MEEQKNINRVMQMSFTNLIAHRNLIELKKSSLSRAQRDMVQRRTQHLLDKGKITIQQIDDSLANLMRMID